MRVIRNRRTSEQGLTLVELIVTVTILTIFALVALPIARFQVKRVKERALHADLDEIRAAIDAYKTAADQGKFQIKVDTFGYPPDLESMTKDIDIQGKKIRFLPHIPDDPMTGKPDWGLRSMQDEPDSTSWGGQNVFDIYTQSEGTALNGTKYNTW